MKLTLFAFLVLVFRLCAFPTATTVVTGSNLIPHISAPEKHPEGRLHLHRKDSKLQSKTHSASKTHSLTMHQTTKRRPTHTTALLTTFRNLRRTSRRRMDLYREIPPNPNTIVSRSVEARQWNSMYQEPEQRAPDSIPCLTEKWQC